MCMVLDTSMWQKLAKYWQTSAFTQAGRGKELFEDIGGEAINPILDDEFDFEDELKAFLGEN